MIYGYKEKKIKKNRILQNFKKIDKSDQVVWAGIQNLYSTQIIKNYLDTLKYDNKNHFINILKNCLLSTNLKSGLLHDEYNNIPKYDILLKVLNNYNNYKIGEDLFNGIHTEKNIKTLNNSKDLYDLNYLNNIPTPKKFILMSPSNSSSITSPTSSINSSNFIK